MSTTVTLDGITSFGIPADGESGWGEEVTNYLVAIASATLLRKGGAFTLLADVDTGVTFGFKSAFFKSRSDFIAAAGVLRLANAESVGWRNNAQSGNLLLTVNASDWLQFNSVDLVDKSTAQALTNKTLVAASNTITTAATGNLAAVELNDALAELQTDIDTRLTTSSASSTYQPLDSDLTALAALATAGLVARTGAGTVEARTLTAGTGLSATNGDGVSGNPTIAIDSTVATLAGAQALTNKTVVVASNTITTAATGNLAATELNTALAELQSDIDTRATSTNATLVNPALGTPASGVMTNVTGTAAGLTAGNVTTNADLTGPITSTGNATAVAAQTGTGTTFVMQASPTLTSPTVTGTLLLQNPSGAQPELHLSEDPDNGTNVVKIKAPATLSADYTLTLPPDDGGANQVLQTDGSGGLSWATVASTVTSTRGDLIKRGASADERLAIGTASHVLKSDGTDPAWGLLVNANIDAAAAIEGSKIAAATGSVAGVVSTGTQTLAGRKDFTTGVTFPSGGGQLDYFVTGSFTATFTQTGGYSQAVTVQYQRIGNIVTLNIPTFNADATATAILSSGATDVPSGARPAIQYRGPAQVAVNSGDAMGVVNVTTAGQITIGGTLAGGNFTSGQNARFGGGGTTTQTISYRGA